MHYLPHIHHRKSIRLKGYDYSGNGLYFITICTKDKRHLFGKIEHTQMLLNNFGQVAFNVWGNLPTRFTDMELDVFQIMPNHMHGIISLNASPVGAGFTPAHDGDNTAHDNNKSAHDGGQSAAGGGGDRAGVNPAPTVGQIVAAYKSLVANNCLQILKQNNANGIMGKIWQRNYYEHIIRTEKSYNNIKNYILRNPSDWEKDTFNK